METLTETIITDSSMIGHNPSTPAGAGQAAGEILLYDNLVRAVKDTPYIIAVSREHPYEEIAAQINLLAQQLRSQASSCRQMRRFLSITASAKDPDHR